MEAHYRHGLLRDIGDLFAAEKVNVTKVDSQSRNGKAKMRFAIVVPDAGQLERLLNLVQRIVDVISVRRI